MNMTDEQITFVLQQAVFAAMRVCEHNGSNPVEAALAVVEAGKAAAKALDQP